jgi:4-hydroxybenzoate polyprenyltransferase
MNAKLELLRMNYWYRNITVIIGIVFAIFIFNLSLSQSILINSIIITLLACLISSASYSLNAITDIDFDKKHPIKSQRPLPSKRIKIKDAVAVTFFLLIISLLFSYLFFSLETTAYLFLLFVAAIFYNIKPIRLKDIPYVDVLSESINNPIRFLIGWSILTDKFPGILILLLVWFSAGFLMTKKRLGELIELKQKSVRYRKVFKYYSKKSLEIAMSIYLLISLMLIGVILLFGML